MKRYLIMCLALCGCEKHESHGAQATVWIDRVDGNQDCITIAQICIDGCQYLKTESGFTHKGNCPNPIHHQAEKP